VGTGGISAVSNAGPLIHFWEIDCLPLLRIFESLHIPDAVWLETVEQGRTPQADVLRLSNVKRHTLLQSEVAPPYPRRLGILCRAASLPVVGHRGASELYGMVLPAPLLSGHRRMESLLRGELLTSQLSQCSPGLLSLAPNPSFQSRQLPLLGCLRVDNFLPLRHTAIGDTYFQEAISGQTAFLHMGHGNRCFQSFRKPNPFRNTGDLFQPTSLDESANTLI
jgi:hypothetical protein